MSAPLRIALFTYSTKPRGGVIHTLALAEHLQALGHVVHIFALGKDQAGFFRPTTVPFSLIPFAVLPDDMVIDERIQRYIQAYFDFLMADRLAPYDIYHVQDCVSANAVWRVREAGRLNSFVRTVHHVDDFVSPGLIQCQKDSIYRPNHRIVVSQYWQNQLREDFGVASTIIYSGVDHERYSPATATRRQAARAGLGLANEFVFQHICGIEPRKNTVRLVRAYQRVKQALDAKGQPSLLLLAGGETMLDYTPFRQEFFALLEHSGLHPDKDVRLLGVVADDRMPGLYQAADALVFPSVKEGWGLVVLEAQASGLPVLSSALPVFHEYLRTGENAVLVNPFDEGAIADGMLQLANDANLRWKLIQAGLLTAQQFTWEATARAHEACYRQWLEATAESATGTD